MIEHTLREGLATSVGTQISSEAEGFVDRQVGLDDEHGCADDLGFFEDMTTTSVQYTIDTTDGNFGTLDFTQVNGFHQTRRSGDGRSVQATTSGWNDLATTTMDGISVQSNIIDVETYTTHVFISQDTFLGGPLETSNDGILDFVQVLYGLGTIQDEVRTGTVGTETPDLTSFSYIIIVFLSQVTGTDLEIVLGADVTVVNVLGQTVGHRASLHLQTVVLVGRFGEAHLVGFFENGFTQISKCNSPAPAMMCSPDSSMIHCTIGSDLAKRLRPSTNLGKSAGILESGNGTGLNQELINTDQTANVTRGNIFNGFNITTHHQDGTLDGLFVQIFLLARNIVGAHDTALLTGGYFTGEYTTESVETTLIGGGYHLGDVHHQRTIGITVLNSDGGFIIMRTFIQHFHTVFLGNDGRRQMDGNHLKQSFTSWQPENCLRVKAQPCKPEPKPTEPFEGSTRTSPIGPPSSL
ncbi:hypothetical protein FF38_01376 [Lucilia cuprina]|uniref:Uncharacterized protein n=1 Tax=Lucilia cuprina TaxID=7375 RepID=A0A0L0C338_LUCCU|nr:hypothetical protein FF38_01376 [Lucilia cuprina]